MVIKNVDNHIELSGLITNIGKILTSQLKDCRT